jgi:hypothetical protein
MSRLSSVADAEHTFEWKVNLTHALLVLLALYVVYKTDILEGVASSNDDERPKGAEIALEEAA